MAASGDAPHFPRSASIDGYGKGGFAFADMSHRGSLLCLPDSIWAWDVTQPSQIDRYALQRVFDAANKIDTLIVGTGTEVWIPPAPLRTAREALRTQHAVVERVTVHLLPHQDESRHENK